MRLISELRVILILVFCCIHPSVEAATGFGPSKAADTSWLAGNWGVRFVIPGYGLEVGDWEDSEKIISELLALETASWVMLNLTHPSFGGIFTSSESLLLNGLGGDRLGSMVEELKRHGKRVILYVAAQGPDLDFLGDARKSRLKEANPRLWAAISAARESWRTRATELGISEQTLFVDTIADFSEAYSELVDGWWFDHGHLVTKEVRERLIKAARNGNAQSLVAWNGGHRRGAAEFSPKVGRDVRPWLLTESTNSADFTDGHITPMQFADPWWFGNEQVLSQLDTWFQDGFRAIPHIFLPAQSDWRAGRELFPADESVKWTEHVIRECGGITWALQLKRPEFSSSQLDPRSLEFARAINSAVKKIERPSEKCNHSYQ